MSNKETAVLYAEELLRLDFGYALWQADPFGEYDEVRIGDAGFLQCDPLFVPIAAFVDRFE
jgi:hypothetical protein